MTELKALIKPFWLKIIQTFINVHQFLFFKETLMENHYISYGEFQLGDQNLLFS